MSNRHKLCSEPPLASLSTPAEPAISEIPAHADRASAPEQVGHTQALSGGHRSQAGTNYGDWVRDGDQGRPPLEYGDDDRREGRRPVP